MAKRREIKNCHDFFACRWRATYRWKVLDEGYNFGLNFTSIKGLHIKYGFPKSQESQFREF